MTPRLPTPCLLAVALSAALATLLNAPAYAANAMDMPAAEKEAVDLDTIRVRGQRLNTYQTDRSTGATKTDTALQDVPQAITVVSPAPQLGQ